tara:strand:+ start:324 stop:1301 length:978 start_codon:yes stop_codon:yes gene_type:complete
MSTKKTIQINPELFSTNKTRKKKEKTIQPKPLIKANSLKKALLKRIKHHAKNREQKYETNNSQKDEEFSNDFHSHLEYLNNVQKKNKTLKRQTTIQDSNNVNANVYLPPELSDVSNEIVNQSKNMIPDTPPYGCLKNGSKPTWREWKRTTQKVPSEPLPKLSLTNNDLDTSDISSIFFKNKVNEFSDRELKLQNLRQKIKEDEIKEKKKKNKVKESTSTLKKKTMKIENHYGKQKNKVSVLVKNSTTRKNIQKEHNLLKQKSIEEVKQYLKKHYLLKVGSNAPNDVLRKMYEAAHLTGNVKNINSKNLLYNYMNDETNDELNEEL